MKNNIPSENSPAWHYIDDIFQEVRNNGYYSENPLIAINILNSYAKNHKERTKLFEHFGLKLELKDNIHEFELISKN